MEDAAAVAVRDLHQQRAFEREQLELGLGTAAAAIAAEAALGSHHAVAWDDDRQGIAAAGLANVARLGAEGAGELAIAAARATGPPAPAADRKYAARRRNRRRAAA